MTRADKDGRALMTRADKDARALMGLEHRGLQLGIWMLAAAACASPQQAPKRRPMNADLLLYQLATADNVICTARITRVAASPGPRPGVETVHIAVEVLETWWGRKPNERQTYNAELPESPVGRMKFPDPIWGRVDLREGAAILIVAPQGNGSVAPVYADEIRDANDPVLRDIRAILQAEAGAKNQASKVDQRLAWLASSSRIQKLFGGESLAKEITAALESRARIVPAYIKAFNAEHEPYVKINLGTWLWSYIWPHVDSIDQTKIVKATMAAAASKDPNVRDFALDRISEVDPALFRARGVGSSPETARLLEKRRSAETDDATRKQLEEIISAIKE